MAAVTDDYGSVTDVTVAPGGAGEKANAIVAEDALTAIYITIGSLGLLGNVFVIVVIFTAKGMRKNFTNTYIINQSLVDASVAFFLIMTSIFEDQGQRPYHGLADQLLCRLWFTKMPLWGLLVSSTYNLVALTFERYCAIVHPIWHKMKFSRKIVMATIACVWIIGPGYNMAFMIPSAGILSDGSCTVYSIYPNAFTGAAVGVVTIFFQYFIPLIVLIICYTRMALVLRRKPPVEIKSSGGDAAPDKDKKQEKKQDTMARARMNIIKTLLMVAMSFIFCWTWNQIYFLMFNLGYPYSDFTSTFYHFTVVMVFCNCCINPFVYIAKYEQFQTAMRKLLCRGSRNRVQDMSDNTASTVTATA